MQTVTLRTSEAIALRKEAKRQLTSRWCRRARCAACHFLREENYLQRAASVNIACQKWRENMKREKLKIKRRRGQHETRPRSFVYKPSARIQRKQVINELRDLPVEELSPHPQEIEMINVHQDLFDSDGNPAVSAISFVTKRGTVHLTVNAQSFHRLYKLLRDNFGPVAAPKRKRTSNTLDVQRG